MKILLATSLILLLSILHSSADQNLIEPVCRSTQDHQLCADILHSDPRSATTDAKGLALLMMDAAKHKAEEAVNTMNNLKATAQPNTAQALQQCQEAYTAVIQSDIPKAQQALKSGDSKLAESMIAGADARSNACRFEEGFGDLAQPAVLAFVRSIIAIARNIILRFIHR